MHYADKKTSDGTSKFDEMRRYNQPNIGNPSFLLVFPDSDAYDEFLKKFTQDKLEGLVRTAKSDFINKNINIEYVWEKESLGTIGAVSLINNFSHDYILVTNSDLLTNIDYEHFFLEFIKQDADLAVLTIPYQINIPYAVLETQNNFIKSFKELWKVCWLQLDINSGYERI